MATGMALLGQSFDVLLINSSGPAADVRSVFKSIFIELLSHIIENFFYFSFFLSSKCKSSSWHEMQIEKVLDILDNSFLRQSGHDNMDCTVECHDHVDQGRIKEGADNDQVRWTDTFIYLIANFFSDSEPETMRGVTRDPFP